MTADRPTNLAPQAETPEFAGFPAGAQATAIPSAFFSELLPLIDDVDELRLTLYVFYALGRRKGYPSFVTERELQAEAPLMEALLPAPRENDTNLAAALARAVSRGSLLRLDIDSDGEPEVLVSVNTPANRRAFEQIVDGRLPLGRALPRLAQAAAGRRENVFQLYESNVGPITPLIAEELREADRLYPHDWLEDAMREAAQLNKRSWRYVSRILQRWATEGRVDEKTESDSSSDGSARSQLLDRYRQLGGR